LDQIEDTREALKNLKVPLPRMPRAKDENQTFDFVCMNCGYDWKNIFLANQERVCPKCQSNSIRWLR
jgi:DNA-directed RNA polymerase subunit M/transcription elongation factor TFIIS